MPEIYDRWWTAIETGDTAIENFDVRKRRKRKKRIVKKPHSDNHFRRIQLLIECQCKRPRICKRTACHHYGIHEFDKDKCGKRKCNFIKIETARIGMATAKAGGRQMLGKPFKVKSNVERHVSCKIMEKI